MESQLYILLCLASFTQNVFRFVYQYFVLFFLIAEYYCVVWIYPNLFIHLPIDGRLVSLKLFFFLSNTRSSKIGEFTPRRSSLAAPCFAPLQTWQKYPALQRLNGASSLWLLFSKGMLEGTVTTANSPRPSSLSSWIQSWVPSQRTRRTLVTLTAWWRSWTSTLMDS